MLQRPSFSLYDASAGSGKTYSLVKEYLKIIVTAKKNDAYRNILAITFTNKAVHEMKSRIVGSLSEFAKEKPSEKAMALLQDVAFDTQLSTAQIQTKSQQIIKHIIHNYAAFDISTIDKFTHKVIRTFVHDLGLPVNFEVTLDTENLLTEAVDALIAQAGEDVALTKLLVDFTLEKTNNDKSWDISREILTTGRLLLNENNREELSHFNNKSINEFMSVKSKLVAICSEIEQQNSLLATQMLTVLDENAIDLKSFSRGTFPSHLIKIKDGAFDPKNKMFREVADVVLNKTAKDKEVIETLLPNLLKQLEQIYSGFEKRDFYKAFLKNITPLSLLNSVSNELTKIQNEQNVLSISEFNAIIYREIQNQPAPFIYERLGEKYRHFFIDEFQDTSEMQWQNLIPLIDNATSSEVDGEKGTLMIVGDPKQSIYRWRGGKAEQFIALSKDYNPFNNPDKKLVHLDKNYRSYTQVIEFNNALFQFLANEFEQPDYKELYQNHSHQKPNEKTGGYVNISFLPVTDKKQEEELDEEQPDKTTQFVAATLNTIQKVLQQGFTYNDIVVLTRKRDQGIAIASFLTEQNIPILSSETLMIQNATEVRFLIHLLKYLKNKNDAEAKAYFLYYIATNNQDTLPIHDCIAQGIQQKTEAEFEIWLQQFKLQLSFQDLRKKSLYEAVELLITTFLTSQNKKGLNAYVQYFLDLVLERDLRNQSGIADFINYWDKNASKFSIPSPEGTNAVRIMTIHKSKGLEFPVVILPFAEEDYSRSPKDKLWLEAEQDTFGLPKILIDNSSAVAGFGEAAKIVYNAKKQEELLDNINILYVALTRAEEQLHIISQLVKPKTTGEYPNNMAAFFIKFLENKHDFSPTKLEYTFGLPKKASPTTVHEDHSKTIPFVSAILNPKAIKIAQKEALMWGTKQQDAIAFGNCLHEILAYIQSKTDVVFAVNQAIETGLIANNQKQIVTQTLLEIVNHPELQPYFSIELEILNEQTILQKEGKTIKPDRMVISQTNEVFLLDYKTGTHQAKYQLQLENYQNAIEKMGYKVTKKALVYIGESIDVVHL